jgi:DNA mismatch endonuclease, patch repair protein
VVDTLTRQRRSELMASVRTKHTGPQLKVRSIVHRLGLRFRLHRNDLPGRPDLVFPRLRAVVFVHGCFWHRHRGCPKSSIPATGTEFWRAKLARNVIRDTAVIRSLRRAGWRVLIVWECETRAQPRLAKKLSKFLNVLKTKIEKPSNGRPRII